MAPHRVRLHGPLLDAGDAWAPRLGVFSIAVINAGGAAEFDNLSLVGPDGAEMLVNPGFAEGLARWFPAAQGYYVPWHIDNLYLELLIERGLPACVAFVLCMAVALRRLVGAGRPRSADRAVPCRVSVRCAVRGPGEQRDGRAAGRVPAVPAHAVCGGDHGNRASRRALIGSLKAFASASMNGALSTARRRLARSVRRQRQALCACGRSVVMMVMVDGGGGPGSDLTIRVACERPACASSASPAAGGTA